MCALDGSRGIFHLAFDETGCSLVGVSLALEQQQGGQWLQTLFAGRLRPCAPLGFEGQVKVLQRGGVPRLFDALAQLVGEFPLFLDGLEDGFLALGYLLQLLVDVVDLCDLHLVEVAGALLAVSCDEGDGAAEVEQGDGVLHSCLRQAELLGYEFCVDVHVMLLLMCLLLLCLC